MKACSLAPTDLISWNLKVRQLRFGNAAGADLDIVWHSLIKIKKITGLSLALIKKFLSRDL